jgi:hypothetical protein
VIFSKTDTVFVVLREILALVALASHLKESRISFKHGLAHIENQFPIGFGSLTAQLREWRRFGC